MDVSRSSSRPSIRRCSMPRRSTCGARPTAASRWETISPNLTRSDPKTMQASGGPITKDQTGVETYAVIFTVAPSRQDGNTIWTGSDDGWVHVTRDGGKNWERVTPPDLPEFARISLIEASPHQNGVAYLAANRYQQGDRKPVRLQDRRTSARRGRRSSTAFPTTISRARFAKTRSAAGCCYVGTEHGHLHLVQRRRDWQSLRLNLPVTPVHGIVSEERDLVIGTHGRGFYVLDDINVLRQATPRHHGERAARLRAERSAARPRQQRRHRLLPRQGRERGEDRDPRRAGRSAALVHRHGRRMPAAHSRAAAAAASARRPPPRVGTTQGHEPLHLGSAAGRRGRVPGHDHVGGAAAARAGVAAGQLRGAHHRQRREPRRATFTIGIDPRLAADGITEAYLLEQFKLSSQVRDKVTEANTAVIKIRAIRDQVDQGAWRRCRHAARPRFRRSPTA